MQRAKKVGPYNPRGASGFCYWARQFCFNLPDRQVKFFGGEFQLQKTGINLAHQNSIFLDYS